MRDACGNSVTTAAAPAAIVAKRMKRRELVDMDILRW
jgi:hypothetical protein